MDKNNLDLRTKQVLNNNSIFRCKIDESNNKENAIKNIFSVSLQEIKANSLLDKVFIDDLNFIINDYLDNIKKFSNEIILIDENIDFLND